MAARRLFPGAPEPFIDLSTGINPHAYPIPALEREAWTRLPEPEALADLQRAAALAYGVADPRLVVAAPGTQMLISLLPLLFPRDSVAVLGPTYAEHAACWRAAGTRVAESATFDALTRADGAVLCNPNNPDGRRFTAAALLALADYHAAKGGFVVVDEAFADFAPAGTSLAPALPHPGLIVLRSFGKAYGLAGLRLGFALAAPERADRLRDALGPWAVSGPAIAAGITALGDAAWRESAAARLTASAARLDTMLNEAGLSVAGGTSLFRLVTGIDAAAWFTTFGRAGILVRRFRDQPDRLRFGLPAEAAHWDRLAGALSRRGVTPRPARRAGRRLEAEAP